jgi:hypothetical protein
MDRRQTNPGQIIEESQQVLQQVLENGSKWLVPGNECPSKSLKIRGNLRTSVENPSFIEKSQVTVENDLSRNNPRKSPES